MVSAGYGIEVILPGRCFRKGLRATRWTAVEPLPHRFPSPSSTTQPRRVAETGTIITHRDGPLIAKASSRGRPKIFEESGVSCVVGATPSGPGGGAEVVRCRPLSLVKRRGDDLLGRGSVKVCDSVADHGAITSLSPSAWSHRSSIWYSEPVRQRLKGLIFDEHRVQIQVFLDCG